MLSASQAFRDAQDMKWAAKTIALRSSKGNSSSLSPDFWRTRRTSKANIFYLKRGARQTWRG